MRTLLFDFRRRCDTHYSQESGIGKLFYIINSRLRTVKSVRDPTRDCYLRAVTESCGDLADFVRLMWEGLNFEFRETPRREVVMFRGVEVSEAALESHRDIIGGFFSWSMFASFTEKRDVAEEYAGAWRGGCPVLFELRSAWCRRLRNRTYLLHPFAVLQVEAVAGNTVKLVEVEPERGPVSQPPGPRPGVGAGRGRRAAIGVAAECGDVRAIARLAARPFLINVGYGQGRTSLHLASLRGQTEAVKALVSFGANVNARMDQGVTPVFLAAQHGHDSTVTVLASLGADVNTPDEGEVAPVCVAAKEGRDSTVRVLASLGADVNARMSDGDTPVFMASRRGKESTVLLLASLVRT
jgi:hypothetical protein